MESIGDDDEQDPLQNQFDALEIEWNSIKQSISRSNRRNLTSTIAAADDHQLFQLYDNSPKELMSSLQYENSPSENHIFNSRNRDQAALEIIKQRKADFDNFRIRGRRLFEGLHGECLDISQESEVSTEFSHPDKGSENGHEKHNQISGFQRSRSDTLAAEGAVKGGSRSRVGGFVGRWMVCVVVMLFALGIVAFKCSGKDEPILVPT